MKTITIESFFKKVSPKQVAAGFPSELLGKKRPDLKWTFEGIESADVPSLNAEQVSFFLNEALASYGRELLAANGANWEFVPSDISLEAAFTAATTKASRERTLTKESAGIFAAFYERHAPELLEIPKAAASAARGVLAGWISYARDEKVRTAMSARLNQFMDSLAELEEDSPVLEEFAAASVDMTAVMEALIKAFSAKEVEVITADAL